MTPEDRRFYQGFWFAFRILESLQGPRREGYDRILEQVRAVARGEVSLVNNPAEVAKDIEAGFGMPINDSMRKLLQDALGGPKRAAMDAEAREEAQRIVDCHDRDGGE